MKRTKLFSLLLCCALLSSLLTVNSFAWGNDMEKVVSSDDQIHYINVNTEHPSDAFLVESNGEYLLVDTSNPDLATGGAQAVENDTANVNEVIRYLKHLGISSLDYVVLTHSHSDHIGGVVRLCQEGLIGEETTVYYRTNEETVEEQLYPYWENALYLRRGLDAIRSAGANIVCLAEENITELELTLGDFSIEFMNLDNDRDGVLDFDSENENNNSIVLMVTKGQVDTLLTGDIEEKIEKELLEELGQIEVLKVPHHGNRTSSSYEFLKTLQPETAIVTSTNYTQYGAYEYLRSIGTDVYTTGYCTAPAIVEAVTENGYEILGGIPYELTSEEGWHEWLGHSYYVEDGQVCRDGWKKIGWDWYYFSEDGIMRTEDLVENGRVYSFRETGEWKRGPF